MFPYISATPLQTVSIQCFLTYQICVPFLFPVETLIDMVRDTIFIAEKAEKIIKEY